MSSAGAGRFWWRVWVDWAVTDEVAVPEWVSWAEARDRLGLRTNAGIRHRIEDGRLRQAVTHAPPHYVADIGVTRSSLDAERDRMEATGELVELDEDTPGWRPWWDAVFHFLFGGR